MSRVFLAEEVRLERRVVVKVLPPEMAAGVSVDRFESEILLAARLQHPHVVPLLTAGSAEELLYYVMPYIEGESLRAKLAREGELPVPEALRILHDVLDALAYAHRQHVVHRDIKPDNVLLSEGHALVTDFGVAKAVAASSGHAVLTSMGVALGTPAYMAPEQAMADPHVDHRADIYAVGVMAYEMLTGRTPFVATTAQAMLAAHVTDPPDPVTRHRTSVSEPLNRLILRCLEKKPADRWQQASEVLQQVTAMATPTAGTTPAGAQLPAPPAGPDAISSGTAAAIARARPLRVASLFALAAVGIVAIVNAAVRLIGLPEWVSYGAVGLLVVGLPIILVTGHHERRRALARSTGATPTPPAFQRWFTWRNALAGGGLAFGGLTLLAGSYMALRELGIGPMGTLMTSGKLAERGLLVVAEFNSLIPDSSLASSVTEAFRIDLSQSPAVKLMDGAAMSAALRRMTRDPTTHVDAATAQDIAQREGAKGVVVGEVGALGKGYVITLRLLSSADGSELLALRETADDDAGIIAAVDRLSNRMRERIGESLKSIRDNPPLEQVTTGSLEALRRYTEGARAADDGHPTSAIQLLEGAIALDTTFAMAYRKLGVVLFNTRGGRANEIAARRKACQYKDRLPLRERYLTVASCARTFDEADAAYQALLATYPDDGIALNNLAFSYMFRGRYAEAEQLARRTTEVLKGALQPYVIAIGAEIAQNRLAAAESTLAAMRVAFPQVRTAHFLGASEIAAARKDFDGAWALGDSVRRLADNNPGVRAGADDWLASLAALRGRLGEAQAYRQQAIAVDRERGVLTAPLREAIQMAYADLRFRDAPQAAARRIDDALRATPLASMPAEDRPYEALAGVYAEAGHAGVARRLLGEAEALDNEDTRHVPPVWRSLAMGAVATAEGKVTDALARLRGALDEPRCSTCGLFELARAYDRAGQADSALAYYERLTTWPLFAPPDGLPWNALPLSYKRLGELYEQRGDRAKALEDYGKFVDLWQNADAELQPLVTDVKQRMARLTAEH